MHHKSFFLTPPPPSDINAHDVFFNRPDQAEWPDFTFHIDALTEKKRTYKEFVARTKASITALGSPVSEGGLGFENGEMIGIMSENSMEYPVLVHALLALTVPFALISAYSTRFELVHTFRLSKITRLFVQPKYLQIALSVAKEVNIPAKRIYIIGGNAKGHRSLGNMVERVQKANIPTLPPRPATKDTLAYLVLSSGTSGLPKAVMITHGNLIYSLSQSVIISQAVMEVYTAPTPPTPEGIPIGLGFLPFHHSYGLHSFCFRHLLAPSTIVILSKWNIEVTLKAIPKYRITNLSLIPSVVHQLLNHPHFSRTDLSSVIVAGSGAAYLPPELAAKFGSFIKNTPFLGEGYGLSECTIAALAQPFPGILGGKVKRIPGCAGILLPGMEARIVREDGTDADANEIGELYLKGYNICQGYWNNEKANQETFVDGWLKTGDRFKADAEGHFFFADRAKDTLKVSGTQVSPMEIENVLLAQPDKLIIDVTVSGVHGHGRTSDEKVPRAWVVLSDAGKAKGASTVIKALEEWHQENLSKYKWLRGGIEVVKEIPKSPTGKVLRRVLVDRYEQRFKKVKGKL
ncbi:acetyl-CoA synthetase-like protein [Marasmius fiardii PR-910]|nr:acetyl-CoA synthetase-like protein [Marasmius fiardii PR-910]